MTIFCAYNKLIPVTAWSNDNDLLLILLDSLLTFRSTSFVSSCMLLQLLLSFTSSDLHASVTGASRSSDLPIKIVLDHDDLLATVRVGPKHALDRGVGSLTLTACDVPSEISNKKHVKSIDKRRVFVVTYALRIMSSK